MAITRFPLLQVSFQWVLTTVLTHLPDVPCLDRPPKQGENPKRLAMREERKNEKATTRQLRGPLNGPGKTRNKGKENKNKNKKRTERRPRLAWCDWPGFHFLERRVLEPFALLHVRVFDSATELEALETRNSELGSRKSGWLLGWLTLLHQKTGFGVVDVLASQ